jgi:hypothetical protein
MSHQHDNEKGRRSPIRCQDQPEQDPSNINLLARLIGFPSSVTASVACDQILLLDPSLASKLLRCCYNVNNGAMSPWHAPKIGLLWATEPLLFDFQEA